MTTIGLPEAHSRILVLVTGSREWTDRDAIIAAFDATEATAGWRVPRARTLSFDLMHGACPLRMVGRHGHRVPGSADMLAHEIARFRPGWKIVESQPGVLGFPADWSNGRGAGFIRNQQMVDVVKAAEGYAWKVCIGFPIDGLDVPYTGPLPGVGGTWDCLKRARKAGIDTWWAYPGMGSSPEVAA